jgi:selenocysteine lyase/cysteine desulfurase
VGVLKTSLTPTVAWDRYRSEFPIFQTKTYFNSCSLGALSTRVAAAVRQFTDQWDANGAAAWYGPWLGEIERLRARLASLLGASADEIALFPSITAALSAVASAFDGVRRPKVVLSDMEFPTTVYQWTAKESRGIKVEMVRSPDTLSVPPERYAHAVDDRTQLLVASHVYFTSGVIQDIAALARIAHDRGAYCLIDAYQATGQLPTDVHASGVDFLVTGGLKWLLGGPGVAYLYVRREVAQSLQPTAVGWFAHRNQFAFDIQHFEYADGARRFEGGTPAVAAIYAGRAGADLVAEIGISQIRQRQVELVSLIVAEARRRGLHPRVPGRVEDLAGIVTIPRADPAGVVKALAQRNIIVDFRPGIVRLSPYFYNTPEECERVVAAITQLETEGLA